MKGMILAAHGGQASLARSDQLGLYHGFNSQHTAIIFRNMKLSRVFTMQFLEDCVAASPIYPSMGPPRECITFMHISAREAADCAECAIIMQRFRLRGLGTSHVDCLVTYRTTVRNQL